METNQQDRAATARRDRPGGLLAGIVAPLLLTLFVNACGTQAATTAPVPNTPSPTGAVPQTNTPVPNSHPPTCTPFSASCAMGDVSTRPSDGMTMLCVPAGPFVMGSSSADPYADDDEKPTHVVYLDAFWIDRTEVTNAQYRKCVEAGACSDTSECGDGDFSSDEQPSVCADWYQAQAYCRWAGARLPTEAEWEKAARGTDGRLYPWGDTFAGSLVNFCDRDCPLPWKDDRAEDGHAYTAPVGSYPEGASPYGALDMAGNVWEWVGDSYDEGYYGSSPKSNPQGPEMVRYRVVRGGSWYDPAYEVRSGNRLRSYPGTRGSRNGFRCGSPYTPSP